MMRHAWRARGAGALAVTLVGAGLASSQPHVLTPAEAERLAAYYLAQGLPGPADPGPHAADVRRTDLVDCEDGCGEEDRVFAGAAPYRTEMMPGYYNRVLNIIGYGAPGACRAVCDRDRRCLAWEARPAAPFGPWEQRVKSECRFYSAVPPRTADVIVPTGYEAVETPRYRCGERLAPLCQWGVQMERWRASRRRPPPAG